MLLWQDPAAVQEAADFQAVASEAVREADSQAAEAASEAAHSVAARDLRAALAADLITHHLHHHIITDPITADGITALFLLATAEAAQAAA